MNYTSSQKKAIFTRGRNMLVSAAAGSGKTAVLTERIVSLITDENDPADISGMLIVTFTTAAAAELRSRITKALTSALLQHPGDRHLASQLTSVGSAKISTIDSFYLDLVKENFQKLSLPSSFRIADPSETTAIKETVLNDIIERRFSEDPSFGHLSDTLTSSRNDSELASIIEKLADDVLNIPEGPESLLRQANEYILESGRPFFESRAGKAALDSALVTLSEFVSRSTKCSAESEEDENCSSYAPDFEYLRTYSSSLLEKLQNRQWSEAKSLASEFSPTMAGRVKRGGQSDFSVRMKNERKSIATGLSLIIDDYLAVSESSISKAQLDTAEVCRTLYSVIKEYLDAYAAEKRQRQMLDFHDLKRHAVSLLTDSSGLPTQIAMSQRARFSHIFVDEYQDTDPVQDLIFRTISNGTNLFIVGDIKQSIYSFRGAEPELFANRRNEWNSDANSNGNDPCSVYMSENFRCSPSIIEFTNTVCSYLFRHSDMRGGGIGYRKEDDLICSRTGDLPSFPVRIVSCETPEGTDDVSLPNPEAAFIVTEIRRIVGNVLKPDGTPYCYADIAVLARKNDVLVSVEEMLTSEGIPFSNAFGERLFENPEVLMFYSVLCAIDNPQRDIHLAAAMKSPVFGFTLSELIKIRAGRTKVSLCDSVSEYSSDGPDPDLSLKCADFLTDLNRLRSESIKMPADRFIRFLFTEAEALSYAGSAPESKKQTPSERRRNLRMLYESAIRYRSSSYKTLHDYINYLNDLISQGRSVITGPSAISDAVQLMTVHKSKGLEFPVVFLCGCGSKFNNTDLTKPYMFTSEGDLGLTVKQTDPTGLCASDNPIRKTAASVLKRKLYDEEIRILYVGLTRARDMLYITAKGKAGSCDKRCEKAADSYWRDDSGSVSSASNWFDWILTALNSPCKKTFYGIETWTQTDGCLEPFREAQETKDISDNYRYTFPASDPETVRRLTENLNYRYGFLNSSLVPSKISVSRLFPGFLDEDPNELILDKKAEGLLSREPRFNSEVITGTDRGTATHLFLQFCDFSRLTPDPESIKKEALRLETEKFIPPGSIDLIRIHELVRFTESSFFSEIMKARKVYREKRFNLILPASKFAISLESKKNLSDETILVQGVIDIFFESFDGKIVLCDYKTDRIPKDIICSLDSVREKMYNVHGNQLRYYAESVSRLLGRYPDEIAVFPLEFGEAVRLDMIEPSAPLSLN